MPPKSNFGMNINIFYEAELQEFWLVIWWPQKQSLQDNKSIGAALSTDYIYLSHLYKTRITFGEIRNSKSNFPDNKNEITIWQGEITR